MGCHQRPSGDQFQHLEEEVVWQAFGDREKQRRKVVKRRGEEGLVCLVWTLFQPQEGSACRWQGSPRGGGSGVGLHRGCFSIGIIPHHFSLL